LLTPWAREVSPASALPEYPRPQMVRQEWQNLNGLWQYAITAKADEKAPVRFDGNILVPYPIESALSGVMKPLRPSERLWYRRTFSIPQKWRDGRILLHFGAVDWEATVFLNGRNLGSHRGGYDPFTFDITGALEKGDQQEIIVSVWDPTDASWQLRGKQTLHPGGSAYTACSGIWQTVWLEPVPKSSVESLHLVPDVAGGTLTVTLDARTPVGTTKVRVMVSEGGRIVSSATGTLGEELTKGVRENLAWYKARSIWVTTDISVPIKDAKLWTPDSPNLYDVTVQLLGDDDNTLDSVTSYVGMRSIAVGKDEHGVPRPVLNGKPIMLPGALDQGYWPDGVYTAPTDTALRFDIEAAKRLGLLAIRKHLKLEPERYYYWADRLGLLILQDFPSGKDGDPYTDLPTSPEASTVCEMERRLLIQSRWNHPSIIAWVLFNEGWGQHDTLRHVRWVRQLDPTRLIDEASGFPRHGGGDIHDTHGGDAPQDGNRVSLDSETAGIGLNAVGHSWPGKLWATGTYDPKTGSEIAAKELYPVDGASRSWYTRRMCDFYREMWKKRQTTGTSGDFKVQLYDVETESNGLLSYDRAVWKVDPAIIAMAARGEAEADAAVVRADAQEYKLGPDSMRHEGVPKGTVTKGMWHSKVFPGTVRDYWVYVPAQYDGRTPACVMVFQDGQAYVDENGDFRVPVVFDNLIHKGEMPVTIGIFVNPGHLGEQPPKSPWEASNRSFEYDTLSDQYARFLLEEILPEVGKRYKLTEDPACRAICGISSGGICAFTVAWQRPDAFRKVLSHVGSFTNIRGGHVYPLLIRATPNKPIRVFLQDGSNDLDNQFGNWWLANQEMAAALKFKQYDYKFVGGTGQHGGKHGGAILPDSLRWLWREYEPKPNLKQR
jgi:enterochelin esterase-like enzyme